MKVYSGMEWSEVNGSKKWNRRGDAFCFVGFIVPTNKGKGSKG
jgi:hypothetical protein